MRIRRARSTPTSCCSSWTSSRATRCSTDTGRIDPVRYPNFAALAADSTWFRNAYSVYDSTTKAVPLILDGVKPHPGTAADRRYHPHSIYDMFARHGYRIVDSEEATALCPPSICRGGRTRRPAIIPNLLGGRPQRFNRWVRTIKPGQPTLWVKHLLLPHNPYIYLPDGTQTRPAPRDLLPGMNTRARLPRRVPHSPQRAALPAPARLHRPAARPPAETAEAAGHLRRHADRGDRRPRHRLPVRRPDAAQREPVERRGADADAAVREAPRPARRARQRRATRARST